MARTASAFRQSDVTRAIKAAKAAGVDVSGFEIRPDRIVVFTGGQPVSAETELDKWLRTDGQG